jgi:hypothetical protein
MKSSQFCFVLKGTCRTNLAIFAQNICALAHMFCGEAKCWLMGVAPLFWLQPVYSGGDAFYGQKFNFL